MTDTTANVGVKETKEIVAGIVELAVVVITEVKKEKKFNFALVANITKTLMGDQVIKDAVTNSKVALDEIKNLDAGEIGQLLAGAIEGGVAAYKALKNAA